MVERPTFTKPDGNQAEIVKELRDKGYTVDIICNLPGLYDLVVTGHYWLRGYKICIPAVSVRVEVKMPGKKLNKNEQKYHDNDKHEENLIVAYCAQDVIDWFEGAI